MDIAAERNAPGRAGEPHAALAHWAGARSGEIALLHKKHGLWHAFRWSELAAYVRGIAGVLAEAAGSAAPRLVVSGDVDTGMIGFALAAPTLGGVVIPVPRRLRGEKLQARVDEAQPTHVYLRNRRDAPHWLNIRPASDSAGQIFLSQVSPRRLGAWQLRPTPAPEATATEIRPKLTLSRALKEKDVLWTEEGSNWPEGLLQVIDLWLNRGDVLALPETSESVIRDRAEIQPTELVLSPGRRQELRAETERRLPEPGSWTRALCDRALAAQGNPGLALLQRRIRWLSGTLRASETRTQQVLLARAGS